MPHSYNSGKLISYSVSVTSESTPDVNTFPSLGLDQNDEQKSDYKNSLQTRKLLVLINSELIGLLKKHSL